MTSKATGRSVGIIGLLALLTACRPLPAGDSPAAEPDVLAARVDALFARWDRKDVPGCAVGIIRDGRLVYGKGFGSANLDYEVPNTPQTIFELASASKAFTCACIALLMDQGKLRPDDDLRQFVPEMHSFDPPVRIRHLVQCHTGLWDPFHVMPLAGWANVPVHSPYSEADLLTVLSGQRRLPFEPGTRFQYGSGDYYWLGLVVKRVTGKSLAEFARETLFRPLGMTRTFYEEDPTRVVQGRAVGHYKEDGTWRQWRTNAYVAGGGGVQTCVEDLVRWDQAVSANRLPAGRYLGEFLREGTLLGNRYVLDADAYRKHVQPDVKNPPAGQYRGLKRIQFTGGFWGMTAGIARFPDQKFTVICLSNNDEISAFGKTREIADVYLADVLQPLPDAGPADEPDRFVRLPAEQLADKVGAYRLLSERRVWKVAVRDGDLHVIDPLNKAWRLKPLSATRFRPVGDTPFYRSARFLFRRDPPGGPYAMTLESNEHGFHEVLEFRRVELVDPSPDQLRAYAQVYDSDELASTYRFAVREGALWLRVGGRRWERLDPTVRDEFIPHVRTPHDNRIITFQRNDKGEVIGLSVGFWRVKGVGFARRQER
jgi:CubicO group peptidase (beta-lactamase class C family)